jgi:uncharacterized membrane protein
MNRQVSGALVVLSWTLSAAVYTRLPARMATHFDIAGAPDRWDPRIVGAFVLPALMLLTFIIARWSPRVLAEQRPRDAAFDAVRELVLTAILAFFALMHVGILGSALGWSVSLPQLLPLGLGGLFLLFGHVLPRLRRSWLIGIRTRKTLTSDDAWERTHRVAGAIMTAGGTVMVGAGLFDATEPMSIVIAAAVGSAIATAGYLYAARG